MKRFLSFFATFSLVEMIGRHPGAVAGSMMLLGVGGLAVFTPPTLVPFTASNFNPNQGFGFTNNGLKPNQGTSGATQLPTADPLNSTVFYGEMIVNPTLSYSPGNEAAFNGWGINTNSIPGQPNFFFQRQWNGSSPGSYWFLNPAPGSQTGGSAGPGSSYATGFYPFTAPIGSCARAPSGVWQGSTAIFQQVDPGEGCPSPAATLNAAAIAADIPGSGAQQATSSTTCTVVGGLAQVTTHVSVAHGLAPGLTYALSGFTPSGYNSATYTALLGTTGTTIIGTTGATSCPAVVSAEGNALSGTGGSINFPAISATNPYNFQSTGIATKNGQHACFFLGEYGDDSNFPGAQYLSMVDEKGNPLVGSPSLVPFLNQGTSNFTGSTSGSTLTVSLMNSYTITGATYNGTTGFVTFPVSTNPGFVPGSEFTVSGIVNSPASPNLFNQTYVAVAGTNTTTVVGSPITGPAGIPAPFGSSPGTYSSGGSLVSVIMPGQTLLQASPAAFIMPYGTNSQTGTGGTGTYALSATPGALGSATIFAYAAFYYSAATSGNPASGVATARTAASIGDFLNVFGQGGTGIAPTHTGWGGSLGNIATLYGKIPTQTGSAPSTADLASICTKQVDITQYAAAQTTGGNTITVHSLYRLNDLGIWGDSGVADFTGSIAGTALTIGSTQYGSSTALASGIVISGAGITGCPATCPTISSGSGTSYVLNTSGGTVSSEPMKAGTFKPALPIQANTFKGYIDTTSGVSTLHVTSLDDGGAHSGFASFTGTLGTSFTARIDDGGTANVNPGNVLTVTSPSGSAPTSAVIGVGTHVSPAVGSGAFTAADVTANVTGLGLNGTYTINGSAQNITGQVMFGSGTLAGPATTLQATGTIVGTIQQGQIVSDGGASLTAAPLLITAGGGSVWTVSPNYYPAINADAAMQATLTTIVPGEYVQNAAIVNPVKVTALGSGAIGLLGNYTLSGLPNASGIVGSSGSPVVFTGTTITDGGSIAPGPALTINDVGPGTIFPVNLSTNLGTLTLSGTYNVAALGGIPSIIQVLVSTTANGPPLVGCVPCNWGAITGTISGGVWSGTIASIPVGGPYFVSIRASNGPAYATLTQSIKVGEVVDAWGNGQVQSIFGSQGGSYTSSFPGLWGLTKSGSAYSNDEVYVAGPPISGSLVANQPLNYYGDRFGVAAAGQSIPESLLYFDQNFLSNLGVPASMFYPARDGVGMSIFTLGNVIQTQTVGVGDGSSTTWCSASKFCTEPTGGVQATATLNGASLTGIWFVGSVGTGGSSNVLTVTTRLGGALEPGMILGATGSPTVLRCLTVCTTPLIIDGSTWLLSSNTAAGATGTTTIPLRADPSLAQIPFGGTTTPWPNFNIQTNGTAISPFLGFGWPLVKAGTFKIIDTDPATSIGTTVCQDTNTFAYNQTGGNCTGAGVTSAFVNYQTGDYQVTFTTAPLSTHAITASWTNVISPETVSNAFSRPQGLDQFGDADGTGFVSTQFSRYPGGINGQIWASQGTDTSFIFMTTGQNQGYQFGGLGYSEELSWLFGTKFPALIPGATASVPFYTTDIFRTEGPITIYSTPGFSNVTADGQWPQDATTSSTFSGTVSGSVLTLTTNAVGPMWEGEILGCVTYNSSTCPIGPVSGTYITSLASGAWGASGSTYNLNNSPGNFAVAAAIQNPVFYSGPGPALFLGTLNDTQALWNAGLSQTISRGNHVGNGFAGGSRATRRWSAMIAGANGLNASDPKIDRVKADAVGCDTADFAAPCFDIGTTYQASASGAISGSTITFTGGLSAHARPFVPGMVLSCAGCTSNRVVLSVSAPPTQSTTSGAGQVGNTFTVVASGSLGVSTTETVTGGCSGTSGVGSNCIDIAFSINVSGTFGTAAALDTCGANNLNGGAPNYAVPSGKCQGNGIGEIIRAFRIGTAQLMYGNGSIAVPAGSVWDDGVDLANGTFNQSAAFTCNLVAAKVVQCLKGPLYTAGAFAGVGQWSNGFTYIAYGDAAVVSGRLASLLGYVGGQSFPFSSGGTGYTNGTTTQTATCATIQGGGTAPKFDVTVAGGAVTNVVPANAALATGLGVGSTCTLTPPTGTGFNGTGSITISLAPAEGTGGIGTYNTDNNTMGMFLYDNSGESGNPLNGFFTNGMGGYFEPGLPLRPFGMFLGERVDGGPVVASCTGGTHTTSGSNTIITFTSSGTLTCNVSFSAQTLVVAGAGGGSSAGGGAGGYCTTVGTPTCGLGSSVTIPSGPTTVTVGAGGAGGVNNSGGSGGTNGSNSVLGSIVTATGGGAGGPCSGSGSPGGSGGSGGGGGCNGGGTTLVGGTGSQGNNGGSSTPSSSPFAAAGGGGAGAVGNGHVSATVAGAGGAGVSNSITGSPVTYAGGGGGGADTTGSTGGAGGAGGGGAGAAPGTAGTPNTGGGGGGSTGASGTLGGLGGSGIIIISCLTSACGP